MALQIGSHVRHQLHMGSHKFILMYGIVKDVTNPYDDGIYEDYLVEWHYPAIYGGYKNWYSALEIEEVIILSIIG